MTAKPKEGTTGGTLGLEQQMSSAASRKMQYRKESPAAAVQKQNMAKSRTFVGPTTHLKSARDQLQSAPNKYTYQFGQYKQQNINNLKSSTASAANKNA